MSAIPIVNLQSTATGPAKAIVNAHQKEQPLKLYAGWFCPFVQRAWTVLEEKQIPYQYIEVNPYAKPQSLFDLNPRALVPTLQYENKPIYESTVICEFLDDAFPTHGPRLFPVDPYERARVRIWVDHCTSRTIPAFIRFLQAKPTSDSQDMVKAREEFVAKLKDLAAELHPQGPFFMGTEPSMVDIVIAPWIMRLWVLDHLKGGQGMPEEGHGGVDEALWARYRIWVNAIRERPSIKNTTSDREHYIPIYSRYL